MIILKKISRMKLEVLRVLHIFKKKFQIFPNSLQKFENNVFHTLREYLEKWSNVE
jgi:hypothetical protein